MKLLILMLIVFATTGCSTFLMKDCEQQGNSQYFHCKRVGLAN